MLFRIPDALAARFRQAVPPPRQRSAFVAKLMEQALSEDDPLYTSGACCGVGFVLECQNAGVA